MECYKEKMTPCDEIIDSRPSDLMEMQSRTSIFFNPVSHAFREHLRDTANGSNLNALDDAELLFSAIPLVTQELRINEGSSSPTESPISAIKPRSDSLRSEASKRRSINQQEQRNSPGSTTPTHNRHSRTTSQLSANIDSTSKSAGNCDLQYPSSESPIKELNIGHHRYSSASANVLSPSPLSLNDESTFDPSIESHGKVDELSHKDFSAQKSRMGPIWVSNERLSGIQALIDSQLFELMEFSAIGEGFFSAMSFGSGSHSGSPLKIRGVLIGREELPPIMEVLDGKICVRAGTVPTLVNLLCSQGVIADVDFTADFLKTYRYFSTANDIARLLILRYLEIGWSIDGFPTRRNDFANQQDTAADMKRQEPLVRTNAQKVADVGKEIDSFIQLRVLNVFKKWIENHPEDFCRSDGLFELVRAFLDKHVKSDPRRIIFVSSILKNMEERVEPLLKAEKSPSTSTWPVHSSKLGNNHHTMSQTALAPHQGTSYSRSRTASENSSMDKLSNHGSASIQSLSGSEPLKRISQTNANASNLLHDRSRSVPGLNQQGEDTNEHSGMSLSRKGSRQAFGKSQPSLSLTLALTMLAPPMIRMSELDPTVIAQQLTLIEHTQFRKIKINEFFCQAWNQQSITTSPIGRPTGKPRSRLVAFISWFNRVAYGIASEVVMTPKLKDRVTAIKRFIFVAHLCLKWNNFNTAFEIVAGLNVGAIARLKKTWKAVPSKYLEVWNMLNRTISDEGSYRVYRQAINALKDRKSGVAMLPYLGVNLKDLTFAEDGNPTFMSAAEAVAAYRANDTTILSDLDAENVVNFSKFRMISKLLDEIVKCQKGTYDFEEDDRVQSWLRDDWVSLDISELYEKSKACEPRTQTS